MSKIIVSVIIPTFNSDRTISLVLASLKNQSYSGQRMEILVVDGGSTDRTLTIAYKHHVRIINNPKTEQNYGKYLGYLKARGRYLLYLDSDEVLKNERSLEIRLKIFQDNPQVRMIIGSGYEDPVNVNFVSSYTNEFGDPFSFFIYRMSKNANYFLKSMKKKYINYRDEKKCTIFNFSNISDLPLIELNAGSGMFDGRFLKKEFPDNKNIVTQLNHSFYLICQKAPLLAITKDDPVVHFSSNTFFKYLRKIEWRIKNNTYFSLTQGKSVFTGREQFLSKKNRNKKYLFIPYAYSLILPLVDAIYLVFVRKNMGYFGHVFLSLYTATLIMYHGFSKILGVKSSLLSYGDNRPLASL